MKPMADDRSALGSTNAANPGLFELETPADAVGGLLREIHELEVRLRTFRTSGEAAAQESMAGRNVLQVLGASGPQTVPQLAQGRSTSRQNVQVLVNRLAKVGCVEFTANPRHRRSLLVRLTERGRALLEELNATDGTVAGLLHAELKADEVQTALKVVRQIRELLAGHPAGKVHRAVIEKPETVTGQREGKGGREKTRTFRQKSMAEETNLEPGNDLPVALL